LQLARVGEGWVPFPIELGAAQYGPYGPPYADAKLQATYDTEWRKLSGSSAFITESTAQSLIASVINSGLAAGESATPGIEAKVRAAAGAAAAKAAKPAAAEGATLAVKPMIVGVAVLGVLAAGTAAWALYRSYKRRKALAGALGRGRGRVLHRRWR